MQIEHQIVYSTILGVRALFKDYRDKGLSQITITDGLIRLYSCPLRGYSLHFDPLTYVLEQTAKRNSVFSCPDKVEGVNTQFRFIQILLNDAKQDLGCVFNIEHYSYQLIGSYSNQLALDY